MKKRSLAALAIASLMLTAISGSAQAAPPMRGEEPLFSLFPDFENGVAIFWNMSRDDFCAWGEGPPPVQQLIPASAHETGQNGELVARFSATSSVEIWLINDPENPIGPCEDTAGQEGPFATGEARVSANDNDLRNTGPRRNSFGERGQGTVTDVTGADWHLSWAFRNQCDVDCMLDFTPRAEQINLKRLGR